jgi:hypothetical protein
VPGGKEGARAWAEDRHFGRLLRIERGRLS